MPSTRIQAMLTTSEAELKSAEDDVSNLRQLVELLRRLVAPEGQSVAPVAPAVAQLDGRTEVVESQARAVKPIDAVHRTLHAHPAQPMDFKAIWSFITEQGWKDESYKAYRNAADAAARRLTADPSIPVHRLPDGRYIYDDERGDVVDGGGAAVPGLLSSTEAGPTASQETMT